MAAGEVPQTLEYRGGQLNAAPILEVENFTNWKKRFMCHIIGIEPQFENIIKNGPFIPMTAGQRKSDNQWTGDERKTANLDQRIKSLIMNFLPDDQMNYVINWLTAKSTWDDLILYKALMNELVNDGIKLSRLEINTGFINGLPKKWLSFCQSLRNTNNVKDSELASLFDSPNDEEDTRSSHEYLNDLEEEYQARALLSKSKRFFKKDVDVDNFKRCCTSYTFDVGYKVLRDFLLHRSSINSSARLSNKFRGFYFSFKFGISGLLHQVITTIADRIREQVKTMKIQAGIQVSRPRELTRQLQLWKRFGRLYLIVFVLVSNIGVDDEEEVYKGGISRVIVYGYDGLPIQPVAPPSPDYIPGLEDPQTPPVPQDEDEREPMFVQAHDPDFIPVPVYPEYIPLGDEYVFPAEEQPLPPVDSPTAESPGYITESDPKEDPKEYKEDESEDGLADYPMDGGDDKDTEDGDSSGDDANDEDEDEEDKEDDEEEEHLAPADSAVVVPTDEPVSQPEGTEPAISPPSIDITIGAKITVRLQASISLSPEAKVVARCTALLAHSSPPPVLSLLLPSSGFTAALPLPLLPPLPPSLYIPPPADCRDDIPDSEQPPRKRLCLSTLGSRYEIEESSTARPTRGRGIDYGFLSTVDAEARQKRISEVRYGIRDAWVDPAKVVSKIAPMTAGEVNTRVTELAELHERDTQDLMTLQETVWMVEEEAYASRKAWAHSIGLSQVHETRFHMQQTEMAELRDTDRGRKAQMVEMLKVMRDMRREMSDMQAELLAHREQQRRVRQPGPEARIPDHQDASGDADSHI
ncbi:hypothetical protein Tco_0509168 [Tanacetum coccineum]